MSSLISILNCRKATLDLKYEYIYIYIVLRFCLRFLILSLSKVDANYIKMDGCGNKSNNHIRSRNRITLLHCSSYVRSNVMRWPNSWWWEWMLILRRPIDFKLMLYFHLLKDSFWTLSLQEKMLLSRDKSRWKTQKCIGNCKLPTNYHG